MVCLASTLVTTETYGWPHGNSLEKHATNTGYIGLIQTQIWKFAVQRSNYRPIIASKQYDGAKWV